MSARLGEATEIEQSGVESSGRPCSRFTKIIRTCPDKLSEDKFFVLHCIPGIKAGTVFTAVDDTFGISGMIFIVAVFCIVISHYINSIGIFCFIGHHDTRQSSCYRARSIDSAYAGCQTFGYHSDTHGVGCIGLIAAKHRLVDLCSIENRVGIGIVRIIYFIADTPQEDGGMIAVTAYHIGDILLYPFFKEVKGAIKARFTFIPSFDTFTFGEFPFIRSFIHDKQT